MKGQSETYVHDTGHLWARQAPSMPALDSRYAVGMEEGPKGPPKPTPARFALAANLLRLKENFRIAAYLEPGISAPQLEQATGVSAKTINRMLDAYEGVSPNLDNIEALAYFFGVNTWDLLTPQPTPETRVKGKERRGPESPAHAIEQKERTKSKR